MEPDFTAYYSLPTAYCLLKGAKRVTPFAIKGRLLVGDALVAGAVIVEDGKIAAIVREPRDGDLPAAVRTAAIVAPGFVDMQVNGGFGVEAGVDKDAISTLAARLPESGVTTFLPTLVTSPIAAVRATYVHWQAARDVAGARPLGVHLEGPFLSPARKGAHRREIIEAAGASLLDEMLAGDALRLMTLAPERPDAPEIMARLRARGVTIALGHTDATYEQYARGIDAGATLATHLYNAMSPFAHRAPGAIGAALADDRITACLIADGIHAHPASLRVAFRAKGPGRVALVTDMMAAAGMGPGQYQLGGQAVTVDDRAARLADRTLAGAILTMDEAVRNAARWMGATVVEALQMASEIPARLLGLAHAGRIAVGCDADFVLLDDALTVRATLRGGATIYERQKGAA